MIDAKLIEEALSEYKVSVGDDGVEVEFWSPAGEDMRITLNGNSLDALAEDAGMEWELFDADDHAAQIYHKKYYGTENEQRFYASAPETLEELLEDAKAIEASLRDIVCKLRKLLQKSGARPDGRE